MIIDCFIYGCLYVCFFFFFKQKTAYEMRISDWSSDVCSSDLMIRRASGGKRSVDDLVFEMIERAKKGLPITDAVWLDMLRREVGEEAVAMRSEEHTSELQSLMRISYAVFCLKNKK